MNRAAARGLLGVLLLLLPLAAQATPVTIYCDGTQLAGFDPDDVAAAIAAGFADPVTVSGLIGGQGYFNVVTPDGIPGTQGSSKANPSTGISTWTLQIADDTPESLLQNFYLVILGHHPSDPLPYLTQNVGLSVDPSDPWTLFRNAAAPDQIYLAYFLGDLDPLKDYSIPIDYRVGQPLYVQGGEYMFPLYGIAFLAAPQVPEPGTMVLFGAALAAGWVARKRPA